MARGQRTNLASLANSVGDHSPVEQAAAMPSRTAPLTDLTPNPRNPRDDLGDLSGLESIADMQLQPAVVVTKSAYLKLYPDDPITTRFVVINGCRRLAAAHKYGRIDLAIVVNDEIARDRVTLISASHRRERRPARLRRHRRSQSRGFSGAGMRGRPRGGQPPA